MSGASGPERAGPPASGGEIPWRPWHKIDDLNADQVAAMQTMDTARREGVLSDADAATIEAMIRRGQTAGARKRVTLARKAARP